MNSQNGAFSECHYFKDLDHDAQQSLTQSSLIEMNFLQPVQFSSPVLLAELGGTSGISWKTQIPHNLHKLIQSFAIAADSSFASHASITYYTNSEGHGCNLIGQWYQGGIHVSPRGRWVILTFVFLSNLYFLQTIHYTTPIGYAKMPIRIII